MLLGHGRIVIASPSRKRCLVGCLDKGNNEGFYSVNKLIYRSFDDSNTRVGLFKYIVYFPCTIQGHNGSYCPVLIADKLALGSGHGVLKMD